MGGHRRSYQKIAVCVLLGVALTGCQTVPQSVKDKTKNYTKNGQVKEVDEQYVSVQHLLDDKDQVLKADYQNMILDDTISLEQPDSVGVLQLEVPQHFATKDKVKTLSKVVLQKEVSDADVKDLSKEKWAIGETYGVGKNEQNMESAEVDQDGSYTAVFAKPWIIGVESVSKIYHPDWGRPLGTCKLNGKEVSLDDQVAYVNEWCDKYTKLFEPDYECKVKTVYQCKGDGVEYLCFEAYKYYKGLPFDDTELMEINNKDGEEQSYVRNVLELTTVGTEKITSLRNNNYSFVVKKEKTYNDHLIGLKQAVRLAEKRMSAAVKNEIVDIDIKYEIVCTEKRTYTQDGEEQFGERKYEARPVWSFIIDAPKYQDPDMSWARQTINVDMITGEVVYHEAYEE